MMTEVRAKNAPRKKLKSLDQRVFEILEDLMAEELNPAIGLALRLKLSEAGLKIVEA